MALQLWEKMTKASKVLETITADGMTLNEAREVLQLAVTSIPVEKVQVKRKREKTA
jgi:hypothetical protein